MGANVRALGALVDDLFEFSRLRRRRLRMDDRGGAARRDRRGDGRGHPAGGRDASCSRARGDRQRPAPGAGQPRTARARARRTCSPTRSATPLPTAASSCALTSATARPRSRYQTRARASPPADRPRIFEPFYRGGNQAARTSSGQRPRPCHRTHDRGGPRRTDLARRSAHRHAHLLHAAARKLTGERHRGRALATLDRQAGADLGRLRTGQAGVLSG